MNTHNSHHRLFSSFLVVFLSTSLSKAQTCHDLLSQPKADCQCPPGLTNAPTCDTLACGSPFVASSKRPPLVTSGAVSTDNPGCGKQCTTGFTGTSCNMCVSSNACQTGLSASSSPTSALASTATQDMVCSNDQLAYGVNFGQCQVENPMLASLFPGKISITLQRNADPSAAPLPSSTLTDLVTGTAAAQLWYAANSSVPPAEQFYCSVSNCTESVNQNVAIWSCSTLKCHCTKPGVAICGGVGGLDLSGVINNLKGSLSFECPISNSTSSTCNLKTEAIVGLLGPKGFALTDCQFGECIQQSVVESKRKVLFRVNSDPLSPGLIVGIAIVVVVIFLLLGLILLGFWRQRKARHPRLPSSLHSDGAARVVWRDLRYTLNVKGSSSSLFRRRRPPAREVRNHDSLDVSVSGHSAATKSPGIQSNASATLPVPEPYVIQCQENDRHGIKQILRGLSGSVEPGTMMAILGPSGAGKSTLLDILAGQKKAGEITGSHFISLPEENPNCTPGQGMTIGFVDQADILPSTCTVREALNFAGKLKLPEDITAEQREVKVAEVLDLLGLAHVAHSKIGNDEVRGLSGGERRRLSIGLELIARPSILFLDEPTSGLDSVSAMRVVNVLKGLSTNAPAGCGTTVVCSIHQPSSQIYHAFDYICLLALGGRQVYCGKRQDAVAEFAKHGLHCSPGYNMADYLLEVASDPPVCLFNDTKGKDSESYPASIQTTPTSYLAKTKPRATTMTQLQSLCHREFICLKRDPGLFWMHNSIALITGVFVGGMYFQVNLTIAGTQNRIGSLLFMGAIIAFSALSALNNFLHVRLLFMRERANRYYSPAAWLLSRLFFDLIPLRLLPSLTMGIIMYFMVGLDSKLEHVLKFLLVVVEYSLVQTLFNLALAATFKQSGISILLSSLSNLLQLAFAGFFVNLTTLTPVLKWIQYLVPLKFSLEAMTVNEVGSGLMIKDQLQGVNIQISASTILSLLFGFEQDAYWRDVIILFGFAAALAILLVLSVYFRLRQTR